MGKEGEGAADSPRKDCLWARSSSSRGPRRRSSGRKEPPAGSAGDIRANIFAKEVLGIFSENQARGEDERPQLVDRQVGDRLAVLYSDRRGGVVGSRVPVPRLHLASFANGATSNPWTTPIRFREEGSIERAVGARHRGTNPETTVLEHSEEAQVTDWVMKVRQIPRGDSVGARTLRTTTRGPTSIES